jgi:hypothetical protein
MSLLVPGRRVVGRPSEFRAVFLVAMPAASMSTPATLAKENWGIRFKH